MNGTIARRIRKSVFGEDFSSRVKEYGVAALKDNLKRLIWPDKQVTLTGSGQILCLGLRSKYKATKKGYKSMKRRGVKHPMGFLLKTKGGEKNGTGSGSKS